MTSSTTPYTTGRPLSEETRLTCAATYRESRAAEETLQLRLDSNSSKVFISSSWRSLSSKMTINSFSSSMRSFGTTKMQIWKRSKRKTSSRSLRVLQSTSAIKCGTNSTPRGARSLRNIPCKAVTSLLSTLCVRDFTRPSNSSQRSCFQ